MTNTIREKRYIKKLREKKDKYISKSFSFYWILSMFLGLCIDLINGFFFQFYNISTCYNFYASNAHLYIFMG